MNSFDVVTHNQVKVGDVLIGLENTTWKNPFQVIALKYQHPEETLVVLESPEGGTTDYLLYSFYKYRTFIRMMQYDPTQQGDTEDDI